MTNNISILSYNIWFSETLHEQRTNSLITKINELNPDVICLQEVRQPIYVTLKKNLISNYKYYYPKKVSSRYGCVIFSKHKIKKCWKYPYINSKMSRSLTAINITLPNTNKEIIIATSHFESIFDKVNEEKINQYTYAKSLMNSFYKEYGNALLCADTNVIDTEEDKLNNIFHDFIDPWTHHGSEDNKYTFNSSLNPYLLKDTKKYMSRLDRFLYKSNDLIFNDFSLINNNYKIGEEPSDHFGIYIQFTY